jgi:hypothetical protein
MISAGNVMTELHVPRTWPGSIYGRKAGEETISHSPPHPILSIIHQWQARSPYGGLAHGLCAIKRGSCSE